MYECVGPCHHLDGTVLLANVAADDLDAVAAEIDDGSAPGLLLVPEPCAVGAGMSLTGSHPGDVSDRTGFYRSECFERLWRVDEIFEVPGEDACRLDPVEDPLRLFGGAGERFGTEYGLSGFGDQVDDLFVEEVR